MKKILAITLACLASVCLSSVASETYSVPALIAQWAKDLGKTVQWEAGPLYEKQIIQLEKAAKVSTNADFLVAFEGMNRIIKTSNLVPLQACSYEKEMVIRRLDQSPCLAACPTNRVFSEELKMCICPRDLGYSTDGKGNCVVKK